jgi:hypothetical protein
MRRVTSGVGGETMGFALVVRRGGGVLGRSMFTVFCSLIGGCGILKEIVCYGC